MHDLTRGEPLVPERGREEALDVVACPQGEPAQRAPPQRQGVAHAERPQRRHAAGSLGEDAVRSEEHTSELQSQSNLVCRLLLEKKKITVVPYVSPHINWSWLHARQAQVPPRTAPQMPHRLTTLPGACSAVPFGARLHPFLLSSP